MKLAMGKFDFSVTINAEGYTSVANNKDVEGYDTSLGKGGVELLFGMADVSIETDAKELGDVARGLIEVCREELHLKEMREERKFEREWQESHRKEGE